MRLFYEEPGIQIYHGDCREFLPHITADVLVTDPPYGVNLGEADTGQERERDRATYTMFSDTPEYLREVVIPGVELALSRVKRGALTPGNRNAFLYPQPEDVGVWWHPAGSGRGRWGFILGHLILYYGADPRGGQTATASSCSWRDNLSVSEWRKDHPCPKPPKFARWLVGKTSLDGEIILDPFMGTGTTLEAAKWTGRRAIGIELDERYCELAVQRLSQGMLPLATSDDLVGKGTPHGVTTENDID